MGYYSIYISCEQSNYEEMEYYCNVCKENISTAEFKYSKEHCGKPLCRKHQNSKETANKPNNSKITPQARKLSLALKAKGIKHKLEEYDGYKHVDIRVSWASLDIEIDGKQHTYNPKQIYSDLERSHYSHEDGFDTLRYSNADIDTDVEKIADAISKVAKRRYRKQDF